MTGRSSAVTTMWEKTAVGVVDGVQLGGDGDGFEVDCDRGLPTTMVTGWSIAVGTWLPWSSVEPRRNGHRLVGVPCCKTLVVEGTREQEQLQHS